MARMISSTFQTTKWYSGFAEVALRHEHLNHILRMTIKTPATLRPEKGLDATAYDRTRRHGLAFGPHLRDPPVS